jgi:hypothetical protein
MAVRYISIMSGALLATPAASLINKSSPPRCDRVREVDVLADPVHRCLVTELVTRLPGTGRNR